jgi:hypothetical protein
MRSALALVLAGICTAPALAAEHPFTITNNTEVMIRRVSVSGGEIVGTATRIAAGEVRELMLVVPDERCVVRVSFDFAGMDRIRITDYDACTGAGFDFVQ